MTLHQDQDMWNRQEGFFFKILQRRKELELLFADEKARGFWILSWTHGEVLKGIRVGLLSVIRLCVPPVCHLLKLDSYPSIETGRRTLIFPPDCVLEEWKDKPWRKPPTIINLPAMWIYVSQGQRNKEAAHFQKNVLSKGSLSSSHTFLKFSQAENKGLPDKWS